MFSNREYGSVFLAESVRVLRGGDEGHEKKFQVPGETRLSRNSEKLF